MGHRNVLDRNSAANKVVHRGHSFRGYIHPSPSLSAIIGQQHSLSDHAAKPISPFCWVLRENQGVNTDRWETSTLDLL